MLSQSHRENERASAEKKNKWNPPAVDVITTKIHKSYSYTKICIDIGFYCHHQTATNRMQDYVYVCSYVLGWIKKSRWKIDFHHLILSNRTKIKGKILKCTLHHSKGNHKREQADLGVGDGEKNGRIRSLASMPRWFMKYVSGSCRKPRLRSTYEAIKR